MLTSRAVVEVLMLAALSRLIFSFSNSIQSKWMWLLLFALDYDYGAYKYHLLFHFIIIAIITQCLLLIFFSSYTHRYWHNRKLIIHSTPRRAGGVVSRRPQHLNIILLNACNPIQHLIHWLYYFLLWFLLLDGASIQLLYLTHFISLWWIGV